MSVNRRILIKKYDEGTEKLKECRSDVPDEKQEVELRKFKEGEKVFVEGVIVDTEYDCPDDLQYKIAFCDSAEGGWFNKKIINGSAIKIEKKTCGDCVYHDSRLEDMCCIDPTTVRRSQRNTAACRHICEKKKSTE
jgi:hypothetical protein